MRVTNSLIRKQISRQLSDNMTRLAEAQQRLGTGIRVGKSSDAPVAAAQIMRITHALRGIEQHERSITSVRTRLSTEEAVLSQITDVLTRAKELGFAQGTDSASPASRAQTAAEVSGLLQQVIMLGNTQVSNQSIFGGGITDAPPFSTVSVVDGDTILAAAPVLDVTIDNGPVVTAGGTFTVTDGDDGDTLTLDNGAGASQTISAAALVGVGGVLDFDMLGIQVTVDGTFVLSNAGDGAGTFDAGTQTLDVERIGTYTGDATVRQSEIGEGQIVDTNHTGQELLLDSNVVDALAELRDAMLGGSGADVRTAIFELDDAFQNTQVLLSDIGTRTRQLDFAADLLVNTAFELNDRGNELKHVPLEEASVEFFAVQTSLDAARLAASRVLQTSLTEFLR